MKRRFLAMLLSWCMVLALSPVSTLAVGTYPAGSSKDAAGEDNLATLLAAGTLTIVIENQTAQPGSEISVPVYLENNPGIVSFRFNVHYDETKLEFINRDNADYALVALNDTKSPIVFNFTDATGGDKTDRNAGVMNFRVKEDASGEAAFTIEVIDPDDFYDTVYNDIIVEVSAGSIEIPSSKKTIIWLDGDGTQLDSKDYDAGEQEPTTDRIPTKAEDAQFTYTFFGWDSGTVSGDTKTYRPNFESHAKTENNTVIWLNGDGTELDRKDYAAGEQEPTTDKTPTKAEDAQFTYTFSSWDSGTVSGNTKTYRPNFESHAKTENNTVIWLNGDGTELDRKDYTAGEQEPITDKTPTKAEDADYIYVFSGWDEGTISGNVKTYQPSFDVVEKESYSVTYNANGGSGTMENTSVKSGTTINLLPNSFNPPDSTFTFRAWRIENTEYKPGDSYTVTGNTSVMAVWQNNNTQGCYVATAVYGSYDCPEVWTLRRYRDQVLAKTWYGRLFIHLYYAVSPTAVRLFGQTQFFQDFFRNILDPWVNNLQADGFESTPYQDRSW